MTKPPSEMLAEFTAWSLQGEHRQTVRMVRELGESGISIESIIQNLLVPSQQEIGRRWQRGEINVADEHIATVAVDAAVSQLSVMHDFVPMGISSVMVCAEGEWHALAARLCTELLRAQGIEVLFLGGSTPAEHVAATAERHRPDVVLVSCTLPTSYKGVARIADAAHRGGFPVLAGGRAFGGGPQVAQRLGADGWASDVASVVALLSDWRANRPVIDAASVQLSADALDLDDRAGYVATTTMRKLNWNHAGPTGYDALELSRIQDDLTWIVRFASAALLVEDPAVFTDHLDWLTNLFDARGIPRERLVAGLVELVEQVHYVNHEAADLFRLGLLYVGQ